MWTLESDFLDSEQWIGRRLVRPVEAPLPDSPARTGNQHGHTFERLHNITVLQNHRERSWAEIVHLVIGDPESSKSLIMSICAPPLHPRHVPTLWPACARNSSTF